jgi:hypothetical protein
MFPLARVPNSLVELPPNVLVVPGRYGPPSCQRHEVPVPVVV